MRPRAAELKGLHARAEPFAEGFQVLVTSRHTGQTAALVAPGTPATYRTRDITVEAKGQ